MSYLLNIHNRLPISFEYAKNVWLFDHDGNRYLDLTSGIGVMTLGHAHPKILYTITAQSTKLSHVSNLVEIPEQELLATQLSKLSGLTSPQQPDGAKVFFSNSGAEAIETAIKLTRLYGSSQKIINPKVITMENGYHGRTLAALSASGIPSIQQGFSPLLDCFIRVPFNNLTKLQATLELSGKDVVAIMLEPIQGAAGVKIPDPNYLNQVRKICTKYNLLMIVDEIQTGIGRTGKLFCYQHNNIIPDVVVAAKGLANGIPIGATIIKQPWANLFTPLSHGSTFGGNPLACSVATTTLNEINQNNLCQATTQLGKYFLQQLQQQLASNKHIIDIRGKGLIIAIELDRPCQQIMQLALKHQLLCNVTNRTTIRLLPPLIIEKQHIDFATKQIALMVKQFYAQ